MRVARNFSRHGITSTFTTEPTPPTFLTRNLLLFYATVAAFGTFAVIVPAPATGSATTTQGTHFFIGLVGKTVRFMFILAVSRMIHEKFRQVSTQLRRCCRLQVISHPVVHLFSESRSIQRRVAAFMSAFQGLDEALVMLLLPVVMVQTVLIPFTSRSHDRGLAIFILFAVFVRKTSFASTFTHVLVPPVHQLWLPDEKFLLRLFLLFLQLLLEFLLLNFCLVFLLSRV